MSTINIDFGLPGTAPDDDFSGAGSSGVWNVIDRVTFTGFEGGPILDFKGNTTSVLITTSQTMSDVSPSSQPFSPSDAPLLGDYLVGGSNTFTMSLHGLSDGWYSFVIYTTGRQDFPRSSTIIPDSDVSASKTNTGLYAGSLQEGYSYNIRPLG